MNASIAAKPYSGLKVLDLSQGIAGPYCAEILLQHGADVVKVESMGGDWGRQIGYARDGMSAIAIAYTLGKRSICIDGAKPDGRSLLRRLALDADIVIEGFRPGVMARLGLARSDLVRERPDQIYVSVSAFGPDGPYANRTGTDSTMQAVTGLMVANRDDAGNPRKIGILLVDVASGVYAAQAVGAALYQRAMSGKGQHIQLSLMEVGAALQSNAMVDEFMRQGSPTRPLTVPGGTYATWDGYINVTALHDRMFEGICRVIGKPEWPGDPRYARAEARWENSKTINAVLNEAFGKEPSAHWLRLLSEQGVVCGPISDYRDFLDDPQARHCGIFRTISQQGMPPLPVPRLPGLSAPVSSESAPRAGENTRAILADLGLDSAEIDRLFRQGIVAWPGMPVP